MLDIVPADTRNTEAFPKYLAHEVINRASDLLLPLQVPQVAKLAVLLTRQRICVNVVDDFVERRRTVHQTPLYMRSMLISILKHLSDMARLAQLFLHPFILFDARDLHASRQELEIWLGQDVRVNSLVVLAFNCAGLVGAFERSSSSRVENGDFSVEQAFKLLGNDASIWQFRANLGKTPHIVVDLSVEVVLLRDLKDGELEHEARIGSQSLIHVPLF